MAVGEVGILLNRNVWVNEKQYEYDCAGVMHTLKKCTISCPFFDGQSDMFDHV